MKHHLVAFAVLCSAVPTKLPAQTPPANSAQLDRIRLALDKYRNPIAAVHDGYFSSVGCVEFPVAGAAGQVPYKPGGMGVHFLNVGLMGPTVDSLRPQVLLYEPIGDTLHLVAAEWFVPTAANRTRPQLFGQPFDGPMEGHHPIMPGELHHWDLHVWLWKPNPAGMFSPTNPALKCPAGKPYSFQDKAPMIVAP